jgi:hypothetical protein
VVPGEGGLVAGPVIGVGADTDTDAKRCPKFVANAVIDCFALAKGATPVNAAAEHTIRATRTNEEINFVGLTLYHLYLQKFLSVDKFHTAAIAAAETSPMETFRPIFPWLSIVYKIVPIAATVRIRKITVEITDSAFRQTPTCFG